MSSSIHLQGPSDEEDEEYDDNWDIDDDDEEAEMEEEEDDWVDYEDEEKMRMHFTTTKTITSRMRGTSLMLTIGRTNRRSDGKERALSQRGTRADRHWHTGRLI